MRLIVVARLDVAQAMNDAAKLVDGLGGERVFTVPLARPANPTTPAAAWCSWDFTATGHDPTVFRQRLRDKGATAAEATPVAPGTTPASQRLAVFRADQWTPADVLAALNLREIDAA